MILGLVLAPRPLSAQAPSHREVSGIYPHLAMFNEENECGTGAVVPWAGRLWVITYAPHKPKGSTDKLYEITPELEQIIRPESIGGTPANRFIHRESQQLFIGPYVIDASRNVRVITPEQMFGRHTGTARHLFDPAGKVYFATMEEGFYEVDVKTLEVRELWADEQVKAGRHADLPGYHGKGFYSGQGRVVYANNGEHGPEALKKPDIPSGVLAEWDGKAEQWTIVRRNQFTEVTGPGGIEGNPNPATDPIWCVGWDHRSLIINVLDDGQWHRYRLPKTSHSYDGAHGWNTEWPRIRDIGEKDLLMTMHGAFWRFPRTFSARDSAGIRPRSSYLKVVADFCRWGDRIVLGCDDTAKSEFLNKRKLKGQAAGPGQSQSNLWFLKPEQLDQLGPVLGRGALWIKDDVKQDEPSDPYLIAGYERKSLHLAHAGDAPLTFDLEVDPQGTGEWKKWKSVELPAAGNFWLDLAGAPAAEWLRLVPRAPGKGVTAFIHSSNADRRRTTPDPIFAGFEPKSADSTPFVLHVRGDNFRTLRCVELQRPYGYDLDAGLQLVRSDDRQGATWVKEHCAPPRDVISVDDASVVYLDEQHRVWRLPRLDGSLSPPGFPITERVCREVCTERDLLNVEGTLYELPAENAGGFARIRPIASHGKYIADYATYRGLLVMAGRESPGDKAHMPTGWPAGGLWIGTVDDLWKFGKPRGHGGPWRKTPVTAHRPSDPYLMTGYDKKELVLVQRGAEQVRMTVEVDFTGNGDWTPYETFEVAGDPVRHTFPEAFAAYWMRVTADHDCQATALLKYE